MSEVLKLEQDPLLELSQVLVSESEVAQEPTIRRATPDFAYEHGGPILRRFLDIAHNAGYIGTNSLAVVRGHNWHSMEMM